MKKILFAHILILGMFLGTRDSFGLTVSDPTKFTLDNSVDTGTYVANSPAYDSICRFQGGKVTTKGNDGTKYYCVKDNSVEAQQSDDAKCGIAAKFFGLGGKDCSAAVTEQSLAKSRTDGIDKLAQTAIVIPGQMAAMKRNASTAYTVQQNNQVINGAAMSLLAKGAMDLYSYSTLKQAGQSALDSAAQMKTAQEAAPSCSKQFPDTISADYQNCVANYLKQHGFGSAHGVALTNLGEGQSQTAAQGNAAKNAANTAGISGIGEVLAGYLTMQQAKQGQQDLSNLNSLAPRAYNLAPGMVPAASFGASTGPTGGAPDPSGADLGPGNANVGNRGIEGGLADKKYDFGGPLSYRGASSGVNGGGFGGGGSIPRGPNSTGASSKPTPKQKNPNVGNVAYEGSGTGSRGGGGASANSSTNDAIKDMLGMMNGQNKPQDNKAIALGDSKEGEQDQDPNRNLAATSASELTIFDQVTFKIRSIHNNGMI